MANKQLERRYLDRALDLLAWTPSGQIQNSETPDFLIPMDGKMVGIEVTCFYLPKANAEQPHQAHAALQRLAVEQARRHFRSLGGPAVHATFFFAPRKPLAKKRAYDLGLKLANRMLTASPPRRLEEPEVRIHPGQSAPEITSISVRGSVNGVDELWYPAMAEWVVPVERGHIEHEIDRKAKMLPVIRQKCERAWLLIVNDGFRTSAPCELSTEARLFDFRSPFDRTLWLEDSRIFDLSSDSKGTAGSP